MSYLELLKLAAPETLVVRFEDDSTEIVQWDDARLWHRFTFVKPVRAKSAELDPDRRNYLDSNRLNDGRTLDPNRSASRRWAGDFSAIVEILYALLGTL